MTVANENIPLLKKTLLIVDDSDFNREFLDVILSDTYNLLTAANGKDGLALLQKHAALISLVLLDIEMPVMDGYEFMKIMQQKSNLSNIPVIVMTASDSESDEVRALETGATDFIPRRFNTQVVLKRIESIIRLSDASAMLAKVEYDKLTHVYSKEFFYDRAVHLLMTDPDAQYDILCLDIASFKIINDRYGTDNGDALLEHIASLLKERLGSKGIIGRISGDIFAVLCPHMPLSDYKELVADFRRDLADFFVPNVVVCFGVYQSVSRSLPISVACDNAQLAIESIKSRYRTDVALYDENVRQRLKHEQLLLDCMENALAENQFKIYFQPKHSLSRDCTGGAEALVRWVHPDFGFVTPGEFIPLFEKNGFITRLDLYMLEQTCKHLRTWLDAGLTLMPVSVNVSRADFELCDLVKSTTDIVDRYNIPRSLVHLEVTESAYAENPAQIAQIVHELKEAGFSVELDDFGSAYSSIVALKDLMPDVIKLDMSIVRGMGSAIQKTILTHILAMSKDLQMETVAEGVETLEQRDALYSMGCTYAQGYLYAKPLPAADFEAYLKNEQERQNPSSDQQPLT